MAKTPNRTNMSFEQPARKNRVPNPSALGLGGLGLGLTEEEELIRQLQAEGKSPVEAAQIRAQANEVEAVDDDLDAELEAVIRAQGQNALADSGFVSPEPDPMTPIELSDEELAEAQANYGSFVEDLTELDPEGAREAYGFTPIDQELGVEAEQDADRQAYIAERMAEGASEAEAAADWMGIIQPAQEAPTRDALIQQGLDAGYSLDIATQFADTALRPMEDTLAEMDSLLPDTELIDDKASEGNIIDENDDHTQTTVGEPSNPASSGLARQDPTSQNNTADAEGVLKELGSSDTDADVVITSGTQRVKELGKKIDSGEMSKTEAAAIAYDEINGIHEQSGSNFFESNRGAIVNGLLTFAAASLMGASNAESAAAGMLGAMGHSEVVRKQRENDYKTAAEMYKDGVSKEAIVAATGRPMEEIDLAIGGLEELNKSKKWQLYNKTAEALSKAHPFAYTNTVLKQQFPSIHNKAMQDMLEQGYGQAPETTGAERIIAGTQEKLATYRKYEDEMLAKYGSTSLADLANKLSPTEKLKMERLNQDVEVATNTRTAFGQILAAEGKADITTGREVQKEVHKKMGTLNPAKDRNMWMRIEETKANMETGPLSNAYSLLDRYVSGEMNDADTVKAYNNLGQLEKEMILRVVQHFKPVSQGNINIAREMAAISPMFQEEYNTVSFDNVQKIIIQDGLGALNAADDANIKYGSGYEGDADPLTYGGDYNFYRSEAAQSKFPTLFDGSEYVGGSGGKSVTRLQFQ